jgi:putative flavoprotein involved in K+ transport
VLVVGASASGVQIADELSRAGRDVVLAVGRHSRMPRRYRGMDIFWWLENTGRLSRTIDDVPDAAAARREPSLQLVGRSGGGPAPDLDLATLQARGVRLAGRLEEMAGSRVRFRPDLADQVAASDEGMHRFLDAVDAYVDRVGLTGEVLEPVRPGRFDVPAPLRSIDLAQEGIGTVLVATGYRPDYSWLHLPITGPDGQIRQHRGVTDAPGVYVVGQRFQHRRDSGFIDGARHDALFIAEHLRTGAPSDLADSLSGEPAA